MSGEIPLLNEPVFPSRFTVRCPTIMAEMVRSMIMKRGLFDPVRSIGRDEMVYLPIIISSKSELEDLTRAINTIKGEVDILDGIVSTGERIPLINPREQVVKELDGVIPGHLMDFIPGSYERIGDSLVLRFDRRIEEYRIDISSAYAKALGSRYVLEDRSGIMGDLRRPTMEVIIPPKDGNYEVIHREGDTRYMLDPRKVMFSSGNTDERSNFPDLVVNTGLPPRLNGSMISDPDRMVETVVDMFSGIGYFTIPLARNRIDRIKIISVEKNPDSYHYLKRNIKLNGVEKIVNPVLGDNREVLSGRIADRIIMGYIGGTIDFFKHALSISVREGSIIHFHDTIEVEHGIPGLFDDLSSIASKEGWDLELMSSHRVKSFAPRIDHVEMDLMAIAMRDPGPRKPDT